MQAHLSEHPQHVGLFHDGRTGWREFRKRIVRQHGVNILAKRWVRLKWLRELRCRYLLALLLLKLYELAHVNSSVISQMESPNSNSAAPTPSRGRDSPTPNQARMFSKHHQLQFFVHSSQSAGGIRGAILHLGRFQSINPHPDRPKSHTNIRKTFTSPSCTYEKGVSKLSGSTPSASTSKISASAPVK